MFKPKSECQKVKGMLSPYIDHQLTSSEQGLVEAHLERCEACCRELESLRAVVNLVHRVPLVSPPRSFAVAEVVPKRRAVPVAVFSAATAVAVLLLAFFFVSDALNLFASEVPVEEQLREEALTIEGAPDMAGGGDETFEAIETVENWPFWQLEVAFSALVVVLGALTIIWWRRSKAVEIAVRS
ncbi:hypothetical protein ES703_07625 [subsurface metagenome]